MDKRTKLEVRYRRLEQEAAQLWQRSQRASPAERARVERRAAQLLSSSSSWAGRVRDTNAISEV